MDSIRIYNENLTHIPDYAQLQRLGPHSHIRGLGLGDDTQPKEFSEGFVGQMKARKALGVVLKMVEGNAIAGRGVLIVGEPETGKTALALGLSRSIPGNVPFVKLSASEVYTEEMSKVEFLTQSFRRCVSVRIGEELEFLEGEVIRFQVDAQTLSTDSKDGKLILKTADMQTTYEIGSKLTQELMKRKVTAGDIVSIEKRSGTVNVLGKTLIKKHDYDATGCDQVFLPCPEGEIQKLKEVYHSSTLHEIDIINGRPDGYAVVFSGDTGEIDRDIRSMINVKVKEWVDENRAEVLHGVLFIDEAHLLDEECFSFINTALENDFSPILVLATNRGFSRVRGTDYTSPHGIPYEILDRMTIITTEPYNKHQLSLIIKQRAEEEDLDLSDEILDLFGHIAKDTSLRYAINLLSVSSVIGSEKKNLLTVRDVTKAYTLFMDVGRSEMYGKCIQQQFSSKLIKGLTEKPVKSNKGGQTEGEVDQVIFAPMNQ